MTQKASPLVGNLKKLISFKTLSRDHQENERALVWIQKELSGLPLYFKQEKSNGFPSLLITTKKTKNPKIWLQSHIDVIPAKESSFLPRVKNNRVFGRGSFDMKFAVACYLELFRELGKELSKYDIGIMLTTDEELGGENGVGYLMKKGYRSKVCILPDGGEDGELETSAKGLYHLEVRANGKSAHGSRPWLGENAIEELTRFILVLKEAFPKGSCDGSLHDHNTFSIGRLEGGEAVNKIPDSAWAHIDMRFTARTRVAEIKKIVSDTKKKFRGIITKELAIIQSSHVDSNNKYVRSFLNVAEAQSSKPFKESFSHGASDAHYFLEHRIPVILTRPKGDGHHGENEWVDIPSLVRFYEILKEFVIKEGKS